MDLLTQLRTSLADRYALDREIGRGGMATVYLARDLRHDRAVAIKVLNPELGAVVGVDRFLAEIKVTASLQHPNLLPLFDSGEVDGQLFYVMPFVDGESLRDRLRREKQLPIDEALRITAAVGSALDHAHRRGVIHRDLKPENILLHDGHPLVADFGIALAVTRAGGERITQTGLSLGTPHYMSPEQATGDRTIDARTDVYSLGAVCYEMLSGDPPHTGSTAQAIIAKVLTDKPRPLHLGRDTVPHHVEAAVERALAKLPADRFASAGEFIAALQSTAPVAVPTGWPTPASYDSDPAIVSARRRRRILALVPWAIAVAATGGAIAVTVLGPKPSREVRMFPLVMPDSTRIRMPTGVTTALSPDAQRLVYAGGRDGGGALYVRELSQLESHIIRGSDRGFNPTFAPDGRTIAYIAEGQLRVIDVAGGAPTIIADSANQPSWADDGTILFVRGGALWRTTRAGGAPTLVRHIDDSLVTNITWPRMLPGNREALVALTRGSVTYARLGVIRLESGEIIDLGVEGTNPWYLPTGHIVFGRAGNALFGAPFDRKRLRITGPVIPLLEGIIVKPGGATEFSLARDGSMLYRTGESTRSLILVDSSGATRAWPLEPRAYVWPRYSPDGRRLAITVGGLTSGARNDVWVLDIASSALTRLTSDGGERAEWTADGNSILTIHQDAQNRRVQIQPWDGSGAPSTYIALRQQIMEISVPRVARGYLAVRIGTGTQRDILIAPLDSPRALRPFLSSPADEAMPTMSPDGKWLAYISDESGRAEVYLRPVPGPGPRVQVSNEGGTEPAWSRDGRTLYYRGAGKFMAARLDYSGREPTFTRRVLFEDVYYSGGPSQANYAVAPDGRSFLFSRSTGMESRNILIQNWTETVRARFTSGSR